SDFDDLTPDPDGKDLRKGVLEIYFAREPRSPPDNLVAYLRWTAKGEHEAPIPAPFTGTFDKAVDVYAPDATLKQQFLHKDEVLVRLVGQLAPPQEKRRLLFRGTFLFDQFKLGENSNVADPNADEPPIDLRWVLARSFSQYDAHGTFRSNFFSEV